MSVAELKEQIAELPASERLELAVFLAELEEQNESQFRQTLVQRMKAMDEGKKVSMASFEEQHQRLKDQGR